MTFFRAAPLHKLFYECPVLPLRFIESAAFQLCGIMKHLHSAAGVVYRDLKLPNILLDLEGQIKLVDFGHSAVIGAAAGGDGEKKGQLSDAVGTHHVRAPEVWSGPSSYGFSCDFFSFGIVLYEMLFGKPPFGFDAPRSCDLRQAEDVNKVLSDDVGLLALAKRYPSAVSSGARAGPQEAAGAIGA